MGAACCCLRGDWEDFSTPSCAFCLNCVCLQYVNQNLLRMYLSLFRRGDRALPASPQGLASIHLTSSNDSSLEDMFRSPPRPLPYDAEPIYYRLQRDGLVTRRDKGSSHSLEESQPLRASEDIEESESVAAKNKCDDKSCAEESKEDDPKTAMKLSAFNPAPGFAHIFTFHDDEDVCPTCLEEYTVEDPKIVTRCSHHFHLGCIYEWMERSDRCPVCAKVMAFDETT